VITPPVQLYHMGEKVFVLVHPERCVVVG
jgi:hypothetical protein